MTPATSFALADDLLDDLPGALREIVEVAGRTAALALVAARGGTEVYFPSPRNLADDHWLVALVGREAAEKLCAHFVLRRPLDRDTRDDDFFEHKGAGALVELPVGAGLRRAMRRTAVRDMTKAGDSASKIALALGVSSRFVTRTRSELRAAGEIE